MEGWKYWEGRKVFIILKNKRTYTGNVIEIETSEKSPIIWMIILDKYDNRIQFSVDEIETIQEEGG